MAREFDPAVIDPAVIDSQGNIYTADPPRIVDGATEPHPTGPKLKTILIRNIEPELHRRVRVRALTDGVTLQEVGRELLRRYG
jgi:hypothetical protein